MLTYSPTGTRTTGDGYSAEILRADGLLPRPFIGPSARYAVRLNFHGLSAIQPCEPEDGRSSYDVAMDLMRAFCGT